MNFRLCVGFKVRVETFISALHRSHTIYSSDPSLIATPASLLVTSSAWGMGMGVWRWSRRGRGSWSRFIKTTNPKQRKQWPHKKEKKFSKNLKSVLSTDKSQNTNTLQNLNMGTITPPPPAPNQIVTFLSQYCYTLRKVSSLVLLHRSGRWGMCIATRCSVSRTRRAKRILRGSSSPWRWTRQSASPSQVSFWSICCTHWLWLP